MFSQIWIQAKFEGDKKNSFYIFGYLFEAFLEMLQFFLKFSIKFWLLKV